jgi:hypothetical protein
MKKLLVFFCTTLCALLFWLSSSAQVGSQDRSPMTEAERLKAMSPNYGISWLSINAGGGPMESANYQASITIGQSAIGESYSTNYRTSLGYWHKEAEISQVPVSSKVGAIVLVLILLVSSTYLLAHRKRRFAG